MSNFLLCVGWIKVHTCVFRRKRYGRSWDIRFLTRWNLELWGYLIDRNQHIGDSRIRVVYFGSCDHRTSLMSLMSLKSLMTQMTRAFRVNISYRNRYEVYLRKVVRNQDSFGLILKNRTSPCSRMVDIRYKHGSDHSSHPAHTSQLRKVRMCHLNHLNYVSCIGSYVAFNLTIKKNHGICVWHMKLITCDKRQWVYVWRSHITATRDVSLPCNNVRIVLTLFFFLTRFDLLVDVSIVCIHSLVIVVSHFVIKGFVCIN